MKFENFNNIDLGNELFYKVRDLEEVDLLKEVSHLPEKDVLETLSHLNSLFMNIIVNPEVTISHHSEDKQKQIIDAISSANYNLKFITLNIRESKSYWRNIRLNNLMNKPLYTDFKSINYIL
jgi:hypothetical protein